MQNAKKHVAYRAQPCKKRTLFGCQTAQTSLSAAYDALPRALRTKNLVLFQQSLHAHATQKARVHFRAN